MAEGRVVSFNAEEGYGFIAPDQGGPDLFVQHSSIETNGAAALAEGQRVAFAVESGANGPRAVKVTPVDGIPPQAPVNGGQQVRHARLLVVGILSAMLLPILVVAYSFVALSNGWWLPGWWPWLVGGLIAAAFGTRLFTK